MSLKLKGQGGARTRGGGGQLVVLSFSVRGSTLDVRIRKSIPALKGLRITT